jgi:[protein-PII] uridylyltransferase
LTAVNLGAALAGLGRSTMLLDADFGLANVDVLLGLKARLNLERATTYRRRRATQAVQPGPPRVVFHDHASSNATVVEVRCATKIGILFRITRALTSVGLDIRHATVQTIGQEVVDTFYVRDWTDQLITDPFHRREIERAILHAVA